MDNGYGTFLTTRKAAMAAYDRAAPEVRFLMQNAVANWSPKYLMHEYRALSEFYPRDRALRRLAGHMNKEERADTLKDYGPLHPEAVQ